MITRVLADANVLYSRTLRDWLILLELETRGGMYKTYWTEDILAEVIYRLRRAHPEWSGGTITTIRDRIATSLKGGRVDDFEIDPAYPGSDADDAHVHSAAIACSAHIVLTCDGGFVEHGDSDALAYEVWRPDEFFTLASSTAPQAVHSVAAQQRKYWARRKGSKSVDDSLRAAGCPEFARFVQPW